MALEQLCAVLKGKRGRGRRPLRVRPRSAPLRRRRLRALCLAQAARRRRCEPALGGAEAGGRRRPRSRPREFHAALRKVCEAKAGGPRLPPQKVVARRPQKPQLGRAGAASEKPRDARASSGSHLLRPGGCDTTAGSGLRTAALPATRTPRAACLPGIARSCCPVLCGG